MNSRHAGGFLTLFHFHAEGGTFEGLEVLFYFRNGGRAEGLEVFCVRSLGIRRGAVLCGLDCGVDRSRSPWPARASGLPSLTFPVIRTMMLLGIQDDGRWRSTQYSTTMDSDRVETR